MFHAVARFSAHQRRPSSFLRYVVDLLLSFKDLALLVEP